MTRAGNAEKCKSYHVTFTTEGFGAVDDECFGPGPETTVTTQDGSKV